jgi:ATP dependent DNA ligase-like protein
MRFQPAIPTRGTKVPAGPEWLHEVKYDGFRLIVHRDGDRVRLLTRNGFDWNGRYPWIAESALKNRTRQFVIDGEVVVLGVDGVSDFEALYSHKHDDEAQLYAFDVDGSRCRRRCWACRRGDRIEARFAAVHEPGYGPSRHFAALRQYVGYRGIPDCGAPSAGGFMGSRPSLP